MLGSDTTLRVTAERCAPEQALLIEVHDGIFTLAGSEALVGTITGNKLNELVELDIEEISP